MFQSSEPAFAADWPIPAADVLAVAASAPISGFETLLAEALGVPANCLALGAGSGELLLAVRLALGSGRVVMPGLHPWRRFVPQAVDVPHRANGHVDLTAMMGTLSGEETDLVIVGSPDPVTGATLLLPEVALILDACPGALVIDGTCHEFAPDQWLQAAIHHDRLLVIRPLTVLSQAVSVAYLVAPPAVAAAVRELLPPLPALLQATAHAWLSLADQWQPVLDDVAGDRQAIYRGLLRTPGLEALPSAANFVCVRGGDEIWQQLAGAGLPVAKVAQNGPLQDLWRVGIGDGDTNQHIVGCLREAALTPA